MLADEWTADHDTHAACSAKIDATQGHGPYLQRENRPTILKQREMPQQRETPQLSSTFSHTSLPPSGELVDTTMEDQFPFLQLILCHRILLWHLLQPNCPISFSYQNKPLSMPPSW